MKPGGPACGGNRVGSKEQHQASPMRPRQGSNLCEHAQTAWRKFGRRSPPRTEAASNGPPTTSRDQADRRQDAWHILSDLTFLHEDRRLRSNGAIPGCPLREWTVQAVGALPPQHRGPTVALHVCCMKPASAAPTVPVVPAASRGSTVLRCTASPLPQGFSACCRGGNYGSAG